MAGGNRRLGHSTQTLIYHQQNHYANVEIKENNCNKRVPVHKANDRLLHFTVDVWSVVMFRRELTAFYVGKFSCAAGWLRWTFCRLSPGPAQGRCYICSAHCCRIDTIPSRRRLANAQKRDAATTHTHTHTHTPYTYTFMHTSSDHKDLYLLRYNLETNFRKCYLIKYSYIFLNLLINSWIKCMKVIFSCLIKNSILSTSYI